MEINPQVVFERLFGDGSTPEERTARRAAGPQHPRLGHGQLARFEGECRRRPTARASTSTSTTCARSSAGCEIAAKASTAAPTIDVPYGVPESFDEHIKLQFDLLALAFQADITRVSHAAVCARSHRPRRIRTAARTISFHGGSHHAEDPKRSQSTRVLNRYHVKMLAYFLDKLQKTPDGDGTLLDHSLILYGSNMGNSNQHLHYDVPHVLVGGASGRLQGRTASGVSVEDRADGQSAAEHPGPVRRPRRRHWRQHRPADRAGVGGNMRVAGGVMSGAVALLWSALALGAATSPVADAAMKGDQKTVATLLAQRADVNAPQADGATALHWAVYRDDLPLVERLLARRRPRERGEPRTARRHSHSPASTAAPG